MMQLPAWEVPTRAAQRQEEVHTTGDESTHRAAGDAVCCAMVREHRQGQACAQAASRAEALEDFCCRACAHLSLEVEVILQEGLYLETWE